MPSEPQKKHEIHIDGNFTNSNVVIGDKNTVSSSTAGENPAATQTSGRVAMPLLRLKQHIEKEDAYRIEIEFDDGDSRQTPEVRFKFRMTDEDREGGWDEFCDVVGGCFNRAISAFNSLISFTSS
jgi:hypothetical protein